MSWNSGQPCKRSLPKALITTPNTWTPIGFRENQSTLLAGYLRQKYAGLHIDVIVTRASPPLEFLLAHRRDLFPNIPIVFATERPVDTRAMAEAGATGIVYANTQARTLELALRLHPKTKQVFVVTGTPNRDKSVESIARKELQGYQDRLPITYLTDLPPDAWKAILKDIPADSIILYGSQQGRDAQGNVLGSRELLAPVASGAKAPIYGMSFASIGYGIVGGYVYTLEENAAKLAQIALRIANGTPVAAIPVERAPEVPMFDWRQLQRWGIREDRLPPGSVIQFRELTAWQQYLWRIVGVVALFAFQSLLIAALLLLRRRSQRSQEELKQYKKRLERIVEERTAELVEARDQAMAASRAKTVFLASMSHELRTPLNAILGLCGLVLREASLSDQHRKDLAIAGASGEHLLGLIDDVLDMAKIETGGVVAESFPINLHTVVREMVDMLRDRAYAKGLELFLDISSHTPQFVWSDPGKLRQVLTNLIGNALKYTDEGSVVVRLDANAADDAGLVVLIFEIEDTGIGIAEEDRSRIFDAFVQAGTTGKRPGTGLGLSISRHFIRMLGGTIQVESTPGRGSWFRIELPARIAAASEVIPGNSQVEQVAGLEPDQPHYRILIVEDQRENWLLLQRLLETAGFETRVAEDGERAVETFRSWHPHFIWMDVSLPVMSGLEAARRIRMLEGGADVKIVAVTASASAAQREEALTSGFDYFLRKPYRHREIFDCMERQLGLRYINRGRSESTDRNSPAPLHPADLSVLPKS